MSRSLNGLAVAIGLLLTLMSVSAAADIANVGRKASIAEIAAWDIDVRPDFKGLPAGSGSVTQGLKLWETKCAACHGAFGDSPDVFPPLVGGTTRADIERGRAAGLHAVTESAKSTMMKLATLSTLWDYIHRAMPFDAPKSLSVDDVYAATAYLLHLADIVPAGFVLSDQNIAQIQKQLPNRDGMTTSHGMTEIGGKPDIISEACMKDCKTNPTSLVVLPASVNGRNGNLANQNRTYGLVRGIDTGRRQ
jgi:cytochrome c